MRAFFISLILSVLIAASEGYPSYYSFMGDRLYDDAKGYKVLLLKEHFQNETMQIQEYLRLSHSTQQQGHAINFKSSSAERINYMNALRFLKIQNETLKPLLLERLEALFKAQQYIYLDSLKANSAFFIQNAKVVKTAALLLKKNTSNSGDEHFFAQLQSTFNQYKTALLKARENEEETACLNDLTALYHYYIKMELAVAKRKCGRLREDYEQMQGYFRTLKFTCKDQKELQETEVISSRYQLSVLESQCRTPR